MSRVERLPTSIVLAPIRFGPLSWLLLVTVAPAPIVTRALSPRLIAVLSLSMVAFGPTVTDVIGVPPTRRPA